MILRSIEVCGWGCYPFRCVIGPFTEGINVIYALNATGKSVLFEALRRGLLDAHRVTGQAIEALRPWGRSLTPCVTIEFSAGGTTYRLDKRFLDDPQASLLRLENGKYVPFAEGDNVTDRVREILGAEAPGRGATRPEHWGEAQVLWAPQGQLPLPEGGLSGGLVEAIRSSLTGQVAGSGGALEARIESAYADLFTPGGKLKTGVNAAPVVRLEEELGQAREELVKAQADEEVLDNLSQSVADLRAANEQAKSREKGLLEDLENARSRAKEQNDLLAEQSTAQAEESAAKAQWESLRQRIEGIREASARRKRAEEEIGRLTPEKEALARELSRCDEEVASRESDLKGLQKSRDDLSQADEKARAAARFAEANRVLNEITSALEAASALELEIAKLREAAGGILSPDETTLGRIRAALARKDQAEAKLDSARITLEVTPLARGSLEILAADDPSSGKMDLTQGETLMVRGVAEVAVEFPGLARIRARGPAEGLEELRDELFKAETELKELTSGFGTNELSVLEVRERQRRELEGDVEKFRVRLEAALNGRTREELETEQTLRVSQREELLANYPDWAEDPPEVETFTAAVQDARRAHDQALSEAEAALERARAVKGGTDRRFSEIRSQLSVEHERVDIAGNDLERLIDDGLTDQERNAALSELALKWDAAKGRVATADKALAQIDGNPQKELEQLERKLAAAAEEVRSTREKELQEQTRLETVVSGAPYLRLARAEEEVTDLERRLAEAKLRSQAIHLLHESLSEERRSAVAAVAAPVEEAAARTLERIGSPRLGRLALDERFGLTTINPVALGGPVPIDRLSGGEQEQVHFAVRLALAEVLSQTERQLVVLDDVLVATDERRFSRVLEILDETAQKVQLLIFTCHPSRYSGLADANRIDLEDALRETEQESAGPSN